MDVIVLIVMSVQIGFTEIFFLGKFLSPTLYNNQCNIQFVIQNRFLTYITLYLMENIFVPAQDLMLYRIVQISFRSGMHRTHGQLRPSYI